MAKTVALLIGNSDDKLSQARWFDFVSDVNVSVRTRASHMHFHGAPPTTDMWQNACWVFEILSERVDACKRQIAEIAKTYGQDGVAWLEGHTEILPVVTVT